VFWSRMRRDMRRQIVLDQLIEMDFESRLKRLDAAVAAHEIKRDEVDSALRIVERLDRVREMRVPLGGRLPGWENLSQPPPGRRPVGINVAADADPNPVLTWLGSAEMPLDIVEAVARPEPRRRRAARKARVVGATRATTQSPVVEAPSIAWLRPD
jgi:hypothetical protein